MANKNYWNKGKRYAVAAATLPLMAAPIIATPIQDVQLLDYAVAHTTVNAGYGLKSEDNLLASTDEDYNGLISREDLINGSPEHSRREDPYTSNQQRKRDEYEINDTDWNEVVFEEVNGSSTAKLALHQDWIDQKGYVVGGVTNMNLPEQGISGPFKITSIKHIIPQKKPVGDDESDDYDYKPVTALFTHVSNQVYNISFDNGEELGVTYQHPIYSVTEGDWRLAGELEVGEVVLTKSGGSTVIKSEKKEGSETVYNLEVKELHNFLVSESGIVVHNSCVNALYKLHKSMFKNADDVTHIMRGNIKGGKAGGVHHKSAITQGTAEEIGARTTRSDGLYKVKVGVKDANGNLIAKTTNGGYSTFFPDSWDQIRVLDEIAHAKKSLTLVSGNTYKGFSKDGLIEIRMYLRGDGTIISAFPKF